MACVLARPTICSIKNMSCITVQLWCAWCQRVPVGSDHCCDPVAHSVLCADCQAVLNEKAVNINVHDVVNMPEIVNLTSDR